MSARPAISVIVPARDAARTLPALLDALAEQEPPGGRELLVIDNGSLDESAELATAHPAVGRVLRRERGEGPGPARDAGAAAARAPRLAFLDADCRPAEGWLTAGLMALAGAELVQGRVLPDPGGATGPWQRTVSVAAPTGLWESANLFVSRRLFETAGGFGPGLEHRLPPALRSPFGEDVMFGWRAQRTGAATAFCAEALAFHEIVPRSAARYIIERGRLALFSPLAAEVPELRRAFFYHRWFLSRRTAALDLALGGVAVAALFRRPRVAALAGLPYLAELVSSAGQWGRRAPAVAAGQLAADLTGAGALLAGSLRTGSLVL